MALTYTITIRIIATNQTAAAVKARAQAIPRDPVIENVFGFVNTADNAAIADPVVTRTISYQAGASCLFPDPHGAEALAGWYKATFERELSTIVTESMGVV